MYAVIETGGKQYRVAPGQTIELDTITGDVGAEWSLIASCDLERF